MVVAVFSRKMRDGVSPGVYEELSDRMWDLVASNPEYGLIGSKDFPGPDGSNVFIAFFETAAGMEAWRRRAEHTVAQRRGREEFYEWYWGFSATLDEAYQFDGEQRVEGPLGAWLPPGFDAAGA